MSIRISRGPQCCHSKRDSCPLSTSGRPRKLCCLRKSELGAPWHIDVSPRLREHGHQRPCHRQSVPPVGQRPDTWRGFWHQRRLRQLFHAFGRHSTHPNDHMRRRPMCARCKFFQRLLIREGDGHSEISGSSRLRSCRAADWPLDLVPAEPERLSARPPDFTRVSAPACGRISRPEPGRPSRRGVLGLPGLPVSIAQPSGRLRTKRKGA